MKENLGDSLEDTEDNYLSGGVRDNEFPLTGCSCTGSTFCYLCVGREDRTGAESGLYATTQEVIRAQIRDVKRDIKKCDNYKSDNKDDNDFVTGIREHLRKILVALMKTQIADLKARSKALDKLN